MHIVSELNIKQEDIDELFVRLPRAKDLLTIIAHERTIRELRRQNLELAKNNVKGDKKVKAEV